MARRITLEASGAARHAALREAGQVARAGGVLAIPTESFYALSASVGTSARQGFALNRVLAIKGRPAGKPLLVLIASLDQLPGLVAEMPAAAQALMRRFWPGPLTIVFPAAAGLPSALTAGTGTVGVRLSADPVLNEILRETGPVTGTSANRSGCPPARTADEVEAQIGAQVDLVVDAGPTPAAQPSTVVTVRGRLHILRDGPIGQPELQAALAEAGIVWSA